MKINSNTFDLENKIVNSKNILFIQDIDGVCIPLVKDPMTRKLDENYIFAVNQLKEEFFVLTCGEHEGKRGVNRIIEKTLKNHIEPKKKSLYFQGLAACGVEYQDNKGGISVEGVSQKEIDFLNIVPELMRPKFRSITKKLFPCMDKKTIDFQR